jgi:hypothetical protein
MSIARRPLLDLPLVAAGTAGSGRNDADGEAPDGDTDGDFDRLSSSFDVPAFLRRQEG